MDTETPQRIPGDPQPSTRPSRRKISPGRRRAGLVAALIVAVVLPLVVWQTWGWWKSDEEAMFESAVADRRGGGPPGGPGGGMSDPQAIRRQFHDRIKAALEVSEPEWANLQPKVERVTRIQEELRPRGGMMGPPGAPPGAQADASEYTEKAELLRAAVEDEQITEQALAANLSAARAARVKLQAELKAAQDDLRKGLTPKQEASLALLGVLD